MRIVNPFRRIFIGINTGTLSKHISSESKGRLNVSDGLCCVWILI
ncbi:hypothetical protein [Neisseria sp.]